MQANRAAAKTRDAFVRLGQSERAGNVGRCLGQTLRDEATGEQKSLGSIQMAQLGEVSETPQSRLTMEGSA